MELDCCLVLETILQHQPTGKSPEERCGIDKRPRKHGQWQRTGRIVSIWEHPSQYKVHANTAAPRTNPFLIAVIAVEYQDAQDANFSKAVQQLCQAACK